MLKDSIQRVIACFASLGSGVQLQIEANLEVFAKANQDQKWAMCILWNKIRDLAQGCDGDVQSLRALSIKLNERNRIVEKAMSHDPFEFEFLTRQLIYSNTDLETDKLSWIEKSVLTDGFLSTFASMGNTNITGVVLTFQNKSDLVECFVAVRQFKRYKFVTVEQLRADPIESMRPVEKTHFAISLIVMSEKIHWAVLIPRIWLQRLVANGTAGPVLHERPSVFDLKTAKNCAHCDKSVRHDRLKCSTCRAAYYCNQDCQREHWREHKNTCAHLSAGGDPSGHY